MEEVFFGEAFNKVMSYLHNKNVPVKLVYNDDTKQTVKIITSSLILYLFFNS